MDGFFIMGPYDADGDLQIGASLPGTTTLDECNGKKGPDGEYRYYLTPNAPYNVACFKGITVGTFDNQDTSNMQCPLKGISSVFCNPDASPVNECRLNMDAKCLDQDPEPFFLFSTNPKLNSLQWQVYSWVFGWSFLLMSLPCLVLLRHLQLSKEKNAVKRFTAAMVLVIAWSRAIVFLVDPHYTREILSPYIVGVLYGLPYPAFNMAMGLVLFVLHDLVLSSKSMKVSQGFLPRTRKIFVLLCFGEFSTQLIADAMRAGGFHFDWLVVCQLYFVWWGFMIAGFALLWSKRLWGTLHKDFRVRCRKMFISIFCAAAMGLANAVNSLALLLSQQLTPGAYFADMVCMRIIELFACAVFLYGISPNRKVHRKASVVSVPSSSTSSSIPHVPSSKQSQKNSPVPGAKFIHTPSFWRSGSRTKVRPGLQQKATLAPASKCTGNPPPPRRRKRKRKTRRSSLE
jgi:hypothetical protein